MVEARLTRGPQPPAWTLATVAAIALSSVGCTMCPDPFDYSGPVPNGSSPQNDFRARSNGILPLGAAPRPWPLIVKDDGPTPTLADEADAPVADGDELQQTVAVVGESDEEAIVDRQPEPAAPAMGSAQPALEPVPTVAQPMDMRPDAGDVTSQVAPQAPPAVPVLPPVPTGETPGWRTRRR